MDVKSNNKMNLHELRQRLYELTDKELDSMSDEELDKMVDELEWNDIQDLYPQDFSGEYSSISLLKFSLISR